MRSKRFLLGAGVALLVAAALTGRPPVLANSTSDYVRCIHLCGDLEPVCEERCRAECAAAFPGDQERIDACAAECQPTCLDLYKQCRVACKVNTR